MTPVTQETPMATTMRWARLSTTTVYWRAWDDGRIALRTEPPHPQDTPEAWHTLPGLFAWSGIDNRHCGATRAESRPLAVPPGWRPTPLGCANENNYGVVHLHGLPPWGEATLMQGGNGWCLLRAHDTHDTP